MFIDSARGNDWEELCEFIFFSESRYSTIKREWSRIADSVERHMQINSHLELPLEPMMQTTGFAFIPKIFFFY